MISTSQDHYYISKVLANKSSSSQGYGFSCGRVWMWELDCEEGWAPKNWCFWTVVLGKTPESPLDCKEIQPVHSKGNQPWDFFGRNDAKVEIPVLWPPHVKSWLVGKDSDAGRDWGQEKNGTTEDEMAGWHHWLNGRESEWTPGVGDGQGGLVCCDSWGRKESDMTERLIWSNLKVLLPGKIRNSQLLTTWPWTSWGSSFWLLPWLKIELQIQLYNLQNYKIAKCLILQVLHTKDRHWSERDVTLRPGMGILGQTQISLTTILSQMPVSHPCQKRHLLTCLSFVFPREASYPSFVLIQVPPLLTLFRFVKDQISECPRWRKDLAWMPLRKKIVNMPKSL